MKFALVTGGTGGHIYPALALAEAIKKKYQCTYEDILFIGNEDRMEKDIIPAHHYQFYGMKASGLQGSILSKLKAIGSSFLVYQEAKKVLREFQPDIVIGFGGYVSSPVMYAAHKLHIKTMIHEQNSIVGTANKTVMKKVDAIVTCYERCSSVFPMSKTRLLGNPRAQIAANAAVDEAYVRQLGIMDDKPVVLIVMGSLGSTTINEKLISMLPDFSYHAHILFVSGKKEYAKVSKALANTSIKVIDYIDQLAILKRVNVMVCRAGATTLAEISAVGIPSILIPSPYVANNHQYINAKEFVDHKAAYMIEEQDLNKDTLKQKLDELLYHPDKYNMMVKAVKELGKPHASDDILLWCDELVR